MGHKFYISPLSQQPKVFRILLLGEDLGLLQEEVVLCGQKSWLPQKCSIGFWK